MPGPTRSSRNPQDVCGVIDTIISRLALAHDKHKEDSTSHNYIGALASQSEVHAYYSLLSDLKTTICNTSQRCSNVVKSYCNEIDKRLSESKVVLDAYKQQSAQMLASASRGDDISQDTISCVNIKQSIVSDKNCKMFSDLSGTESQQELIREQFIYPLLYPNLFKNKSTGLLLYGLPGTGKTLLMRAAVNQLQQEGGDSVSVLFYTPTGAELKGKYVGETEKRIRAYFDCAERAASCCSVDGKRKSIAVIFIDEIENIAGSRDKDQSGMMSNSVNMLLQMMDGFSQKENVIVVGATNFPWNLDSAVLRRFTNQIHFGLPNVLAIKSIIRNSITSYCESVLSYKHDTSSDIKDMFDSVDKRNCDSMFVSRKKKENNKDGGNKDDPNSWMCKTKCTSSQRLDFETYRDALFPDFTDDNIDEIARDVHAKNFSSSDVDRLMNSVFQRMATFAKNNGVFQKRTDKNGKVIYISNMDKPFANNDMLKQNDTDTIHIGSNIVGPSQLTFIDDNVTKVLKNLRSFDENVSVSGIDINKLRIMISSTKPEFDFFGYENDIILHYQVTKDDESADVYVYPHVAEDIIDLKPNEPKWWQIFSQKISKTLTDNMIALSRRIYIVYNNQTYFITNDTQVRDISNYISTKHTYLQTNNVIIDGKENQTIIQYFQNVFGDNNASTMDNVSFELSNDKVIRPPQKDNYNNKNIATMFFDKAFFEYALLNNPSNISPVVSTIKADEMKRMQTYVSNPAAYQS